MDVEIFNFDTLKKHIKMHNYHLKKSMLPFIWKSKNFNIYKFPPKHNFSKYRLTLDYKDFELISKIISSLYRKNSYFNMLISLNSSNNNHLILLNNKFIRNESWKKSLEIDKKFIIMKKIIKISKLN